MKKIIINKLRSLDPLFREKIYKKKFNKKDKNIVEKIFKLFDKRHKYTYCLNENNLIISSTKDKIENSHLKNKLSKHIILCENNPCSAGEMIFYKKKYMVFDDNSGTYKPSKENLLYLKKRLNFLNVIISERNSSKHKIYFKGK